MTQQLLDGVPEYFVVYQLQPMLDERRQKMTHTDLMRAIHAIRTQSATTGERMFMDIPETWFDAHKFRCANNHVSSLIILSEGYGGNICPECYEPVMMTFPEDKTGPLDHPALCQREEKCA